MDQDVELLRAILLFLATAERSPPESIFISLSGLASRFGASVSDIGECLSFLKERAFVEGPGLYDADAYLFRKMTQKGRILVDATRDPRDWEEAKALYLPSARRGRFP